MTITKAALRTAVLNAADATSSSWRWNLDVGGEVDFWIGDVHDSEWARILNANRYYRVARRTPTSDSSGRYLISDLTQGTGDDQERLYRVIAVAIDGIVYKETEAAHNVITAYAGSTIALPDPYYYWWFEGNYIMALPRQLSKQADVILVNHRPPSFPSLEAEDSIVDFPEGYESVIVWQAAAQLLHKGGVESLAAAPLERQAENARSNLLQDVARRSTNPVRMQFSDYAADWGSV